MLASHSTKPRSSRLRPLEDTGTSSRKGARDGGLGCRFIYIESIILSHNFPATVCSPSNVCLELRQPAVGLRIPTDEAVLPEKDAEEPIIVSGNKWRSEIYSSSRTVVIGTGHQSTAPQYRAQQGTLSAVPLSHVGHLVFSWLSWTHVLDGSILHP